MNIFYLKIFLKLQINTTQHLYDFYLFVIFFKSGEIFYIYYPKTMWILNMFIYNFFMGKKNLQDIIVVQMYEMMKIQIH